ncbi:hypothetical protein SAMN02983003_3110 [Devosia enhydra]|uniref:Uncharacterized protein n=1 Tax=Devosia enhydra TaxID=665118 RepID=A0A1K2I0M5_9HYPH|nr:hypothetical protein SAMN02983003_3110 [Devosia enhydra]
MAALASMTICTEACDIAYYPATLAEKIAGVKQIYGGTVVGYVVEGGAQVLGAPPRQCLNEQGQLRWWDWEWGNFPPKCSKYQNVSAALFRVDTAIIGPTTGEITPFEMTWGDGDCNTDFNVGEKWFIAGFWVQEPLTAPIRPDEVEILRRVATRPSIGWHPTP